MKLVAMEMPSKTEECTFHTNYDPTDVMGSVVDIAFDKPTYYCFLTRKICDLKNGECSGLLKAEAWHRGSR